MFIHLSRIKPILLITVSFPLIVLFPAALLSAQPRLQGETSLVSRWKESNNLKGCEIGLEMSLHVKRGEVKIEAGCGTSEFDGT